MNIKKLLLATAAAGVVANLVDFVVQGWILAGYYSRLTNLFRQDTPVAWLIIGDFVAVLVLVWVYDRVYGSFGGGLKGGATFGFYAGVLVNFPMALFLHLLFVGFPYGLAWIWTVYGILWGVVVGGVAGALYKK